MDRTPLRYSRAFPSRPAEFSVAPLTMAPQPQFSQSYRLGIGSEFQSRPVPWGPHLTVRPALLSLPVVFSFQISCLGPVFVCLCLIVCIGESVCRFVHLYICKCVPRWERVDPLPQNWGDAGGCEPLDMRVGAYLASSGRAVVLLTAEPYLPSLGAVLWEVTYYRERNSPKTPEPSALVCCLFPCCFIIFYFIGPTFYFLPCLQVSIDFTWTFLWSLAPVLCSVTKEAISQSPCLLPGACGTSGEIWSICN